MISNSTENQEKINATAEYFDSVKTPISNLLNYLILKNNQIQIISSEIVNSNNQLEKISAKFVYTNKMFDIKINRVGEDILISFVLNGNDSLSGEEKEICKNIMKELNSIGFCFYIENQNNTFAFETEIEGKVQTSSKPARKTNRTNAKIMEPEWIQINQKLHDLAIPFKIANRIRVQRNNFMKRYGNDYIPYIKEYAEKQITEFVRGA